MALVLNMLSSGNKVIIIIIIVIIKLIFRIMVYYAEKDVFLSWRISLLPEDLFSELFAPECLGVGGLFAYYKSRLENMCCCCCVGVLWTFDTFQVISGAIS